MRLQRRWGHTSHVLLFFPPLRFSLVLCLTSSFISFYFLSSPRPLRSDPLPTSTPPVLPLLPEAVQWPSLAVQKVLLASPEKTKNNKR